MPKLTLEFEEDYDFKLLGICSHIKDYRLVWELNKTLQFDLQKENNFDLNIKGELQSHSFFGFQDEENLLEYYLLNNRSNKGLLIPEENKCDYFLLIKGNISDDHTESITKKIVDIKYVLTSYEIEVDNLKSKDNLLF